MEKLILVAIVALLLCNCTNSQLKTETIAKQQQNVLEITNDMEDANTIIPSWINEKTVIVTKEPSAHSGRYAAVTNDTIEYSYAYQELLKNIHSGVPKRMILSGWVYSTVTNPKLGFILNISENQQQYDWKVYSMEDLTETGKWVEFKNTYYMDKPLTPDHEFRIYAWNQSKKPIYFDDLKIRFEYE